MANINQQPKVGLWPSAMPGLETHVPGFSPDLNGAYLRLNVLCDVEKSNIF
jgi:hypothetical protein